mmetsp:Transcript_44931/g.70319  ORF Transcript_44931/g.70319 Transcript_44931/m.70319 type:complete len:294 (-) Transcript_44931:701-1582(-)
MIAQDGIIQRQEPGDSKGGGAVSHSKTAAAAPSARRPTASRSAAPGRGRSAAARPAACEPPGRRWRRQRPHRRRPVPRPPPASGTEPPPGPGRPPGPPRCRSPRAGSSTGRPTGAGRRPPRSQGPPPPPPPLSSRPYTPATRGAAALRSGAAATPSSSASPAVEGVVDGAGDGLHERGGERDVRQPGEEAAGGHARQLLHAALAVLVGEQLHQWDLLAGLGGLLDLRDGHVQGQRAHGAGGAAQQARHDLLRAGELVVRVAPLVDHILGHHAEEKAGGPVGHALGAEDRGALH